MSDSQNCHVSGADIVQICLVLRLICAQINCLLGTLLSLPAVAFRHPYFSCPGDSSYRVHGCKFPVCLGGGFWRYPFLFVWMQLSLMALEAFFQFAGACVCQRQVQIMPSTDPADTLNSYNSP